MAEVEVRDIRKAFGGVPAVDGVNLVCHDGEYLVLLGPSGCGKTTLLRMIAGLEHPTEGDILIGGHSVRGLPPRARKIAMVFQSYALYPHKTVEHNISFPLEAQGMTKEERATRVRWAAGLLGIESLLQRKPRQLSGSSASRRSSCSTSRSQTSTPSSAPRRASSSSSSSSAWPPRPSMSPMTRSRRWGSATGSPS